MKRIEGADQSEVKRSGEVEVGSRFGQEGGAGRGESRWRLVQ